MIRFNCPSCGRPYELPDALAGLPLLCKRCGQRVTPPAPAPDPPPPPLPPAKPQAAATPAPKPVPAPTKLHAPRPPEPPDDEDVLVSKPDSSPDIDFNIGGPTATSLSEAARPRPAGMSDATRRPPDLSGAAVPPDSLTELNLDLLGLPPAPPPKPPAKPRAAPPDPPPDPTPEPSVMPFLADLGVFVLLVVAGLMLGEFAVRRPMGEVLSEAGSAAKFPPIDLLVMFGPATMFGLVYLLLAGREKTVGAWLRRRR